MVSLLFRQVNRTNAELTRFLNAIRFGDFLQSFTIEHLGSGFADLNEAFDDIMQRFRKARSDKEQQARYLSALIDHVPVALLVKTRTAAALAQAGVAGADEVTLEEMEHQVIERVLRKHKGNVSRAAKELGITRTSLYRRMDKYGL